ncbi:Mobile element protein [Acidisarcina polymorpha]|uniref:Mobile element protein n=1 Tax=Acidisarcina polymorpha TaxID=2211140 RepID=A0A2Z5FZS7_9BACT|nr:Mobile element protein [Acidisarcina polymorpha]
MRSGRKQIAQRRHLSDAALLVHIRAVFAANRGAYGWPRVWRQLLRQGVRVGKLRVQRLMQQHGTRARGKRRFRITTNSRHGLPVAPNLLDRNFTAHMPNRAWAGDVTYIPTNEGWLYLAVVIDLFSRRIVGWSMRGDMRSEIVVDALEMAWFQRSPGKDAGLIFHSDRGSQYAGHEFSQVLNEYGITPSMSRKGNCWDNACSETLFGSLKVERLHGMCFETIRQAKDETLDWMLWYNRTRLHSTLNYISPMQLEQRWQDNPQAFAA